MCSSDLRGAKSSGKNMHVSILRSMWGRRPWEMGSMGLEADSMYVKEGCMELRARVGKEQRIARFICQLGQRSFSKTPIAPWLSE